MSGRVPDSSIFEEEFLEMIVFDAEEEVKKKPGENNIQNV